jgi:nucleoside-diphosphate-sugar epimerase
MKNKIVITGAAGWLGSRLVEKALELTGAEVIGLKLPGEKISASLAKIPVGQLRWVDGDVRNPADCTRLFAGLERPLLLHVAGIIHPKKVKQLFDVNLDGTRNLVNAAIQAGARRAVVMSSNSPFGCNSHSDQLFDETSDFNPYMNYGRSKMLMEKFLREPAVTDKIEVRVIRSPWFYGPNQPERQTLFFQMIRDGKVPIVGSGDYARSMSYIDNLCDGMLLAALKGNERYNAYWIADLRPYSMNEVVRTVRELLRDDFGVPCKEGSLKLPYMVGQIAETCDFLLQSAGLYHQKIHVLSEMNKTIACSVRKAQQELGYAPQVDLREGMRRSLKWVMENYPQVLRPA